MSQLHFQISFFVQPKYVPILISVSKRISDNLLNHHIKQQEGNIKTDDNNNNATATLELKNNSEHEQANLQCITLF